MEPNEFLDELLDRHSYYVNVRGLTSEGITTIRINYQGDEDEAYNVTYSDDQDFAGVQYFAKVLAEEPRYELFYLPTFLVRIYIFMHIMKRINEKNLSYNCVRFFNEEHERVEGLYNLIADPILEEEKNKEKEIDAILASVISDKKLLGKIDERLKEMGMYHVFYLVKGLIV